MSHRVIVCGELHLSKGAFERAQSADLLELYEQGADDDVSFHPRSVSAKALFSPEEAEEQVRSWARNTYDPRTSRWIVAASLHDDDWHNADPALLTDGLAGLKDREGSDFIIAFNEWNRELDAAWRIERGLAVALEELPALAEDVQEHLAVGEIEEAVERLRVLLGLSRGGD